MDAKLRYLISKVKKEHDDDSVDRTIYATSVYILAFFAILVRQEFSVYFMRNYRR